MGKHIVLTVLFVLLGTKSALMAQDIPSRAGHSLPTSSPITRLAFGSCFHQKGSYKIFEAIERFEPHVWVWMGDNIYADTMDLALMREKYQRVLGNPLYEALRRRAQIVGTWDDHDYGLDNAGKEFPAKRGSQTEFLNFLGLPAEDPLRRQEGIYTSHRFGPAGQQVHLILLDLRFHRDVPGPEADLLGEAQWKWLESELRSSPAEVTLLVSSTQLIAYEHRFCRWSQYPSAQKRLYGLLSQKGVPPVVILSGDRHFAEISRDELSLPYPLYEITSSSLNRPLLVKREPNAQRIGRNYARANFGTLEIDWKESPPQLHLAIRNKKGERVVSLATQSFRRATGTDSALKLGDDEKN